jgi:tetratricopeptide (TPR) repeat protein
LQLALYCSTSACFHQGKYEEAQHHAEHAFAISRESGEQWLRAIVLNDLGSIARVLGNHALARVYFQTSLDIRKAFDDSQGMAAALSHLGMVALFERNYEESGHLYQESHDLYKGIGDRGGTGYTLRGLGTTPSHQVIIG